MTRHLHPETTPRALRPSPYPNYDESAASHQAAPALRSTATRRAEHRTTLTHAATPRTGSRPTRKGLQP
ncbi:hypothetical protein FB157_11174 [Streptomyces sp. BK340]|nr:hypothetical protein FB157_11174 [Streptomyces sp. BK340]